MGATDVVKDNVYARAREAMNFFHEVEMLVINRDTAQVGNGRHPSQCTGSVHLQPGEAQALRTQEPRISPSGRMVLRARAVTGGGREACSP